MGRGLGDASEYLHPGNRNACRFCSAVVTVKENEEEKSQTDIQAWQYLGFSIFALASTGRRRESLFVSPHPISGAATIMEATCAPLLTEGRIDDMG